ncbi:MAG TPA: DUF2279 domain-containing protein [Gemmatimonadaceae bacterium]|nr:DUF2279 domain-containing protein [Gemmatimonadaceae bacterium]
MKLIGIAAAIAALGWMSSARVVAAQNADSVRVPADSSRFLSDSVRTSPTEPRLTGIQTQDCYPNGCEPPKAAATCGHGSADVALRRAAVGSAFVAGNAALFAYFKRAWWSGEKAPNFFFHADWDQNFRDQDKFGHFSGGYHLARGGYALLKSACMSKKKALILSSAYAASFQLQIEIWDGLYAKYGFSYADILANTAGTALNVLHETHPKTRAIKPTISYWPSAAMRNADNIPGELRPSLDYSGQTYWFSADVNALLPLQAKPYWPSFLRISAGHTITDWVDPKTGANFRAKRKIVLSLDFDAEKLPGNNRLWKTVKRQLSYIHLPGPTLQLTPKLDAFGFYK